MRCLILVVSLIAMSTSASMSTAETRNNMGIRGMHDAPIHYAARVGDRSSVEKILQGDPKQRDSQTPLGTTPLHFAALNPDPGALEALISAGAAVNSRDNDGATPLHIAAFTARSKNAVALLKAGADPKIKTNEGRDVLSMARKARSDEVAGIVALWVLKGCQVEKPC
jgi:ankyrin repeat protein